MRSVFVPLKRQPAHPPTKAAARTMEKGWAHRGRQMEKIFGPSFGAASLVSEEPAEDP